ncbi:hypothetical protein [Coleofasciculus sp.]|uniref:hypothetical protein n=1 Tax=Coleofasciculus sp. TaxID=3100458 RepID=UPI003A3F1BE6
MHNLSKDAGEQGCRGAGVQGKPGNTSTSLGVSAGEAGEDSGETNCLGGTMNNKPQKNI